MLEITLSKNQFEMLFGDKNKGDLEMSSNMYNLELCQNLFRTLQFRTMLSPYRQICGEKGFFYRC